MANPPKANQAPAPAAASTATTTSTPAPSASQLPILDREAKVALARAIATRARRWGREEALVFLGAILKRHGIAPAAIDSICAAIDFNGAVVNCSQFAQWADGTAKEPDRLELGFPLRASETRAKSIADSIADL